MVELSIRKSTSTMDILTNRQNEILNFIATFQKTHGYSPSILEVMGQTGIKSTRGVTIHLDALQKMGYILREKGSKRAIRIINFPTDYLVDAEDTLISVPIYGEVQAGPFCFAEETREGTVQVPVTHLHGRKDAFILRIKGNSMNKAGFNPGDLAVVAPQSTANNNDIVIAYSSEDDGCTIKRFKKINDYLVLMPESNDPNYKPIIKKEIQILGKVIDKIKI